MSNPKDEAVRLMGQGWLCAESVLMAVTAAKGLSSPLIPRVATAFCSGMGRSCGTCGAVTGALIAVGLLTGRDTPERPLLDQAYAPALAFMDAFRAAYGAIDCLTLTGGCDFKTAEGRQRYKADNVKDKCIAYVASATEMALAALAAQPGK